MLNIINHLLVHSRYSPEKTAFIVLDNEQRELVITYSQLEQRIAALVMRLQQHDRKNKRVLLVYQEVLDFIVSFLACQYTGIIPVPVPYVKGQKQVARLANVMKDAQCCAVFCNDSSIAPLELEMGAYVRQNQIEVIATNGFNERKHLLDINNIADTEISFIQYTSGSTGTPKGVVVTHKNLLYNQQLIKATFACDAGSVICSWLPFHHDMGLIGNILHAIYIGCTCILMSPFHFVQRPRSWLEIISKYKVTHSGGPDFAYDLCIEKVPRTELHDLDLSNWKVAYNGSEPVRNDTIQRFCDHFDSIGFRPEAIRPCYGLAEATLLVSGQKANAVPLTIFVKKNSAYTNRIELIAPGPQARPIVSCGRPASGITIKIITVTTQQECTELQEGEIHITGDSVTTGYWNDRDNGMITWDNKLFRRTGDLGFLYKGELFISGRLKEILIIRGRNIYPYDIEEAVASVNTAIVRNGVAAFSIEEEDEKLIIVAEVKRSMVKGIDAATVIRAIEEAVISACKITPFEILLTTPFSIPRTTSGKLQRINCRDLYLKKMISAIGCKTAFFGNDTGHFRDPELLEALTDRGDYNTIRKYLLGLLKDKKVLINPDQLTDDSGLTEIGIDSVRMMEIINVINKELSINIDVARVLKENTLSGLIRLIENMLWLKNIGHLGKEITI